MQHLQFLSDFTKLYSQVVYFTVPELLVQMTFEFPPQQGMEYSLCHPACWGQLCHWFSTHGTLMLCEEKLLVICHPPKPKFLPIA